MVVKNQLTKAWYKNLSQNRNINIKLYYVFVEQEAVMKQIENLKISFHNFKKEMEDQYIDGIV